MEALFSTIQARKNANPDESYVASLHQKGLNKILEKVGEETAELIIAAKDTGVTGDSTELVKETADLWFHTLVMLDHLGETPETVLAELQRRAGTSGLEEKRARRT